MTWLRLLQCVAFATRTSLSLKISSDKPMVSTTSFDVSLKDPIPKTNRASGLDSRGFASRCNWLEARPEQVLLPSDLVVHSSKIYLNQDSLRLILIPLSGSTYGSTNHLKHETCLSQFEILRSRSLDDCSPIQYRFSQYRVY